MKQFYLFLIVIIGVLFLNGCSKNDDNTVETQTEVVLPKEVYRLQIVEAKFSEPLSSQEEYDGNLSGTAIKLVRADDHTLFFYVPGEIAVGQVVLAVPQLNISHTFDVKKPILKGNAETVLQPVFEKTTPEYQQISAPEYADYLTTVNATLKDYYQTLTAEEKNDMALFYQINEKLFSEILDVNAQKGDPVKDVYALVRRHQKAVAAMFLGGVLVATGAPVIGSAVVIAGVVKILQDDGVLVAGINVVMNYVRENEVIDKPAFNKTFNAGDLVFVADELQAVNLYAKQRKMISSDRNSGAIGLVTFFEAHDMLYGIARKINEEITRRKDNWFFSRIPLIPVPEFPNTAETTTVALTEEAFGYMTFSVADSNVKITESKFENGTIRMKMTILNPAIVTGNSIKTQLNYTYKEEFSNASGSFLITVNLNTDDFLVGNWKLVDYAGTPADVYHSLSTCGGGSSTQEGFTVYGTATFTQNTFSSPTGKNQVCRDCTTNQPVPGLHWNNPNYSPHSGTYESNGNYQFTITSSFPSFQVNNTITVIDENTIIISYYYGNKRYVRQ